MAVELGMDKVDSGRRVLQAARLACADSQQHSRRGSLALIIMSLVMAIYLANVIMKRQYLFNSAGDNNM